MNSPENTSDSMPPLWERIASQWRLLGSPMRPVAEDIALFENALGKWRGDCDVPTIRALLLGVTPELRAMSWPTDTTLIACDNSLPMIRTVWPDTPLSGTAALPVCSDWRSLPLSPQSCNVAIGDGYPVLLSPQAVRWVIREFDRVLTPNGIVVLRLFMRPASTEDPDAVVAEALSGQIRSFHAFRWRLFMALQGNSWDGVCVGYAWQTFSALFPDREILSRQSGWPTEIIATFDSNRGSKEHYHFYDLDELADLLSPDFKIVSVDFPTYELGERCPVIVARRH